MIVDNKYHNWYNNLIEKARLRNGGNEKHHILPRSLKGGNEKENLVLLTYREHYLAHLLLVRFTTGDDHYKMLSAVQNFAEWGKHREFKRNSHLYAKHREEWLLLLSERRTGEKHPLFGKPVSEKTRLAQSIAGRGRPKSEEHKNSIRISNTGKTRTEETKEKMRTNTKKKTAWVSFNHGESTTITNIREFCRNNNLRYDSMKRVLNPNHPLECHRGWVGRYIEEEYA